MDAMVARMRGERPAPPEERPKRAKPTRSEHEEQCEVVAWARRHAPVVPALGRLFAVPNGGHRSKAAAGKIRAEGSSPGVPDLALPVPMGEYHGCWIEMKSMSGYPSREQREWIAYLTGAGYRATVQRGARLAIIEICGYLGLSLERYAPEYVES